MRRGRCAAGRLLIAPSSAAAGSIFINEFHYDDGGTDAGEFVEVAAPTGTDLSTYAVVLYNGSGGASYDTDPLSAFTASGPFGPSGVFTLWTLAYPVNGIQNGSPDGIALVQGTTVLEFLSYEGSFTATNGPASGMTSVDIGVSELGVLDGHQSD